MLHQNKSLRSLIGLLNNIIDLDIKTSNELKEFEGTKIEIIFERKIKFSIQILEGKFIALPQNLSKDIDFIINFDFVSLLKTATSLNLDKSVIKGDAELAIALFNTLNPKKIKIELLVDRFFGSDAAFFVLAMTKAATNNLNENRAIDPNLQAKIRDLSIRVDRLEYIKKL